MNSASIIGRAISGGLVESVALVEFGRVAHACELPFGWMPGSQASLVVVFRLVWPHVVQDVFAHERVHVAFRVVVRYGCGLGDGLAVAGPGFRVAFALVFELADGPVVGDLIPVVGQSAGGVDATEPVRVRGQPVDDREDERQGYRAVGVVGFGDPVDEVPDFGVVTLRSSATAWSGWP